MSDHHLLYLVGEPASGKSAVMEAITAGWDAVDVQVGLLRYRVLETDPQVIELGARRASFSGTDALAMNVQPVAQSWFEKKLAHYVIAEGDRLANKKFFRAVADAGWYFHVACLEASPATLVQRRHDRAFMLGVEPQSTTWVKGRQTKLRNMLAALPRHSVSYHRHDDGATAEVVRELVAIDPVAKILQGGAS